MMVLDNKYELRQEVYLRTDMDQLKRIVTAITIRHTGLLYELSCGERNSSHYEFEISGEVDETIKIS